MKYLLGPLFLISALIFACGGSGGKALSDEDAVRKVVNDFESVFNSNNPASGYNLLSADSQKGCKQSDFVGIVTFAKAFLGSQKITVETKDVKISGNTAIATTVSSLDGEPQDPSDISLVKESGNWRIVLDSADCSLSGSADPSSNPPGTPTKVPTPPSVKSKRTSTSPVSATSGGVKITIQSVQVADFQEYLAAVDSSTRQDINFASESKDAVTIGLIQVKIENNTSGKIQLSPRDSTVVVGSEQESTASFLGDDDLDGDYFPGVFKEGTIYFFLKRIKPADVASILVAVDAPYDSSTYNSLGDDFQLKVTF